MNTSNPADVSPAKRPDTISLPAKDITGDHILVGASGGLSQVYEQNPSNVMPGMIVVETEHGFLYLDDSPEQTFDVLVTA